ncbi:uncharacterized protein PODANS_5_11480 [Podospora anserina S mat+]|uniref:Podospora anserina S mat+ genomic DNA chromosome 5, supercontig 10 n=1 Tax=Podospora anserina (strain S / ATCC MYA-4624 / DSM 980 / FGSC 10383) TaxID=515849 RepID=B2APM3_PODAN|nr:uncharacterized protein PODANS_5_11480 [Podospora anserina S mat+]CAP65955.1 unnamed protein product [Podospora anserina S mat+]CDP30183.1 Putative protein of unknown function [Podospora anserina S mat+]
MHSILVLATLPLAALAALNGRCTGSAATGKWGESGICVRTSTCNSYGGSYKTGACPNDPSDVKCCLVGITPNAATQPCGADSWCTWTSNGCLGRWISGKSFRSSISLFCRHQLLIKCLERCPGGSNYKCCNI